MELVGTEVKSIRAGHVDLSDAHARIDARQIFLHNLNIKPYERAGFAQHDPRRIRRLLLHRAEIDRLTRAIESKGLALVALRLYWKKSRVKVELGLGRGKTRHDHRDDLRRRADERDTEREIARTRRRASP